MNDKHNRHQADRSSLARDDTLIAQASIAGSPLVKPDLAAAVRQIVFIDGAAPDAKLLAAGVKPGVVAVVLDPNGDEVQQIAAYLASHDVKNLAAIDIVAHGSDGALHLGTAVLDASTIPDYAGDLAAIGAALRPGGAIQLYGCDVAQDAAGVAFLQQLADATGGANIAAASHLVGAAAGGGDWTLNVDAGTVNVAAPFTATTLAGYQGELSPVTTGTLWLGSWNGQVNSNLNQLDALSMSGASPGTTIDVADTTKTGNSTLYQISSLAVDPISGTTVILGLDDWSIGSVPTGGGAFTTLYSAPDTGFTSNEDGSIGAVAVDEQTSKIYFTQQDYGPNPPYPQIAADTGVFEMSESGGTATQVVNDVSNGTTLLNPTSLALDLANNLAFFIENDTFSGGGGTAELYVGSLTGHNFAPLLTIPVGAYNTSYEINTSLAIDPTTDTLYFATGQFGTTSADGIYSVHYTPGGTLATVGSTSTLYTGAAAQDPYALAVDAANNLLFVTGTTIGNSGSSDAASAWVGSTSGSATLSEIFQLGGQTLDNYSYTNAAVFEATPGLSAGGSVNYAPGGGAVTLDAALTVSDESETDLASATVAITNHVSGDALNFANQNGITGSYNGSSGVLTLTGAASVADYQAALDSITFSSTSATIGARTIEWTVNDGLIASSTPTSTVDVRAAPTVTAGGTVAFTGGGGGGGGAIALDASLSVSDPSSTTLSSATVTIGGAIGVDTLAVGTPGGLGTSHSNGTLTLTGSASLNTYQTALDSITYHTSPSDADPTGGGGNTTRTISWVVNDGVLASTAADSTLDTVHAAPTVTAGGSVGFTRGDAAVTLDAALSVSDPDSNGTLDSATVSIGSGFLSGDTLNFVDTAKIAGGYNAGSGTLTLTGADSIGDYQAALQSITYSFSGDPTDGGVDTLRTISWSVSDGVDGSAPATSSLTTTQCFCAGTRIATPDGEVPVETLRPGDLVRLADGGAAPLRWLGRHAVSRRFGDPLRDWPIRVRAGALADGVPRRDLLVSPGHALRVGEMLVNAGALVNGSSVVREQWIPETIVYWHIELDTHALVIAEGAPAESFLDIGEELAFDNRASRPAPGAATELPYPRCKSPRQLPRQVREALAARAAAIRPRDAAA